MVYGVKYQSYLKGYYGIIIFDNKKMAIECYNMLKNEAYDNLDIEILFNNAITQEEEFSYSDLNIEVFKNFAITVNNNGMVSQNLVNLRIINNDYVTL